MLIVTVMRDIVLVMCIVYIVFCVAGKVKEKGVLRPTDAAYYTPILEGLRQEGIAATSWTEPLP